MTAIKDREILRSLAGRLAEIVNSEDMENRRDIWRRTNDLVDRSVPFIIEDNGTFLEDLMPTLDCEGETERDFEQYMRRTICNYDYIPDDRLFHHFFPVHLKIDRPAICPVEYTRAADAQGRILGYETDTPLADLESGLKKLRRGEFKVDREGTNQNIELARDIFGDIIPVDVTTYAGTATGNSMAQKAVTLMGMESFYMAMIDQPENIHRFFEFVATESIDFMNWLIKEDLFYLNNGADWVGSGSIGYSKELPRRDITNKPILPEDCWCFIEAQEAVGLSNEMFTEFIFPYMNRVAQHYGLVYYGCCEPVHEFWPTLKDIKNLRKITISPWCNQEIMADAVCKEVVLSRKPHPMQLCAEVFNPEGFTAHIKESLDIAKDNFIELVFRDTNPLHGGMKDRVAEACNIVKKLIGR